MISRQFLQYPRHLIVPYPQEAPPIDRDNHIAHGNLGRPRGNTPFPYPLNEGIPSSVVSDGEAERGLLLC